ncbi:hypothetical protein DM01DRAFT_1334937 [Hesseltinella vesiculosa]|uniref:BEACH domain-containing protein n=1 Tax=Hesseltinella vesiculosa TaxID=101127 RepID=A0A1X2GJT2_9FUNG|nr:hypothetical protein DM01DRAFT_1334937 [Hesseltinella vesiculosa]
MSNGALSLKELIKEHLNIDVAFPFVAAGESKQDIACCVVDTDWFDAIKSASDTVQLKTPTFIRHASGESVQKQAPTLNILVTVLRQSWGPQLSNHFNLYYQTTLDQDQHSMKTPHIHWPLTSYIHELLEGKGEELLFTDVFCNFDPLFDQPISDEQFQMFVSRLHAMFWPTSPVYQIKAHSPSQLTLKNITEQKAAPNGLPDPAVDMSNANLLDVFAMIETDAACFLLSSFHGNSLRDLIKYNPGILHSNLKKGFIVYQLLRALASLHSRGVVHGRLKTSDVLVNENMWIELSGLEYSSSRATDRSTAATLDRLGFDPIPLYKEIQQEPLVMQWVRGDISNYSYLMILNSLAGRRQGDPNFHPILPWVTDFSGDRVEDGWRDFSKTKFRMNKGDEQLDFTFEGPIPHHITDILSDITYYVYLARRTPISVLCQFVRSKYEPNEYPSSMERLYHWTPDECIPEFYTDPAIFHSVHSDMPDLQLPRWASNPEDFIYQHAKALESEYVSSNLHHWIDLTFGKHLTGKEGIQSKNVALPLLAGQNTFMKHGIVQLFQCNHPQRGCNWNEARRLYDHQQHVHQDFVPTLVTMETSSSERSSILNQRPSRANSSPLPNITKSIVDSPPSMTLCTTRDHAISVHSTASSSIDTTSLSIQAKPISLDASQAAPSASPLSSFLRTDPIRLPLDMPDNYFTESLNHYEHTMDFSAAYRSEMNDAALYELPTHAYLPQHRPTYNIDPASHMPLPTNKFSMETAHDMLTLADIIRDIYLCGQNSNNAAFNDDQLALEDYGSDWITDAKHPFLSDYFASEPGTMPVEVQGVIAALQSPQWHERPTAKSILLASFSSTTLQHPRFSLPLAPCLPDMYEFLATFYQAEWSRRLYLADKWIDRICDLEDEAFLLILPSFVQLFSQPETRIGSIGLFSKLSHRLGAENSKKYLLKPIIALFETMRPKIPKVLFDTKVVHDFIRGLGIPLFLQQLLPCYLEALAIDEMFVNGAEDSMSPSDSNASISSPKLVTNLAADCIPYICQQLGPVLTSKHVIRQLVKLMFREDPVKPVLLRVVVDVVGCLFGDTFTAVQHTYLISLLELPTTAQDLTLRQARIDSILLNVFSQLLPLMSVSTVLSELRSGFMTTLYKMLDPTIVRHSASVMTPMQLTLSMDTIQYLLQLTARIPLVDWEALVIPTLRKYFSGFTSTLCLAEDKDTNTIDPQRMYLMMYTYSRLCEIIGKSSVRRLVPTSAAIEKLMHEMFQREDSPTSSASSDSASDHQQHTEEFPATSPRSNSIKSKQSTTSLVDDVSAHTLFNVSGLYACASKNRLQFVPDTLIIPSERRARHLGNHQALSPTPASPDQSEANGTKATEKER